MISANDPRLTSWVTVRPESDFPIQNLPFGVFSLNGMAPRVGVAIGSMVLDLSILAKKSDALKGTGLEPESLSQPSLNPFILLGKSVTNAVRNRISEVLRAENAAIWAQTPVMAEALLPQSEVTMHLPVQIGDYTDFYSSIEHATNVGIMFRDPENALLPNWKHIPVGYHGRASSILVSGQNICRPKGQTVPVDGQPPVYGPSRLLDFELEMAFVVGKANDLGDQISTAQAEDHIFGLTLFNDWSARDIQKWEYVPLGPFLGKNFASTMSPWIVTIEALEPFKVAGPDQNPEPLPYLKYSGLKNYDINLEVFIEPDGSEPHKVSNSNFKYMYWNMCQQLAHHTVNGCNMRVGDVCASGTISGPTPDSYGSMLEISWKGTKPIAMPDGSERKFIQDNDAVIMRGFALKNGIRVGFGEARAKVLPAK